MIDYLIGFSLLCLIYAVWKLSRKKKFNPDYHDVVRRESLSFQMYKMREFVKNETAKVVGKHSKYYISAKIAEKTADRAFSMSSSNTIAIIALQKALAVPRFLTKKQTDQNILAKKQVDDIYGQDMFEMLRPVLGEEENAILDKVLEHKQKKEYNGTN